MIHDITPLSRILIPRTFIVYHMDPLGCPYPALTLPDTSCLLLSFVSLPHLFLHSILLLFLPCIYFSFSLFSLGMDSCYTLRMDSFSTVSNSPPFTSNTPYLISCFSIYRAIWPYIFQVTLY